MSPRRDERSRVRRQAAEPRAARSARVFEVLTPLLGDPDPIVAHTAVQALVSLKASDAAFEVIDSPLMADGHAPARFSALRVLSRSMRCRLSMACSVASKPSRPRPPPRPDHYPRPARPPRGLLARR